MSLLNVDSSAPRYAASQACNFARPPDWRWRRALQIVESGRYASRKRDDAVTCKAVCLLRALQRGYTKRAARNLLKREPSMMLALKLHEQGGRQRVELQSRILARQPAATIAEAMGLTADVVLAYVDLFFSVEDRIYAPGYVMYQVIKWPPDDSAPTAEQLAMAIAFHHGPAALDAYLEYLPCQGEAHDLTTALGRTCEAFELLTSALALRADEVTQKSLATKTPFVMETAANLVRTRTPGQVLASETARMIAELPWPVEQTAPSAPAECRPETNVGLRSHQEGKVA